jgi:hypothetical protein
MITYEGSHNNNDIAPSPSPSPARGEGKYKFPPHRGGRVRVGVVRCQPYYENVNNGKEKDEDHH